MCSAMLKLDTVEQSWLNDYRQTLDSNFTDLVEDIVIFGSKARGDAGPDSDLDVLVVIREADRQTKSEVRRIGHLLSVMSDALPSIVVYTRAEWQERARDDSPFYRAVMRDGVHVARIENP